MKTLTLLALSLLLLAAHAVQAAPPLTVAVYDFKGDGEAAGYASAITPLVTADLATEPNLVMLERAELGKALNEQAFGISGMVNSDAAAKIGQLTGVKILVAGQVIETDGNHLIILANIIGTDTGRLFAAKVEGAADNLMQLTADLSQKITQTILAQATNLMAPPVETHEERIARIVKSITGKNRPSVSVVLTAGNGSGNNWNDNIGTGELGAILMKAGFTVVDDNSDKKPDVTITGTVGNNDGPAHGDLHSARVIVEVKIQERRTGDIICYDHQDATATDLGEGTAVSAADIEATDELAERILPLLAQ